MQGNPDRLLHVFEVRVMETAACARRVVELGAVRLDRHDGLRERASFERRVQFDDGASPDPDAVSLAPALQAFLRFVGADGPLLSFGDACAPLLESCKDAGLSDEIDPRRFGDAAPVIAKGLGVDPPCRRSALPAWTGIAAGARGKDALHDARAIARTLRWLQLRGRLF